MSALKSIFVGIFEIEKKWEKKSEWTVLVRSTLALCNFPIRSYPVGGGGVLGANWPFYITKDLTEECVMFVL
jgi:hypothetical protein